MKRADDPRHKRREKAIAELFAYDFLKHKRLSPLARTAVDQLAAIDQIVSACADQWPIEKINKIDLAILRLAISELRLRKVPEKVIIDEAVELAKTFGSRSSPAFVNGVLGTSLTKLKSQEKGAE